MTPQFGRWITLNVFLGALALGLTVFLRAMAGKADTILTSVVNSSDLVSVPLALSITTLAEILDTDPPKDLRVFYDWTKVIFGMASFSSILLYGWMTKDLIDYANDTGFRERMCYILVPFATIIAIFASVVACKLLMKKEAA